MLAVVPARGGSKGVPRKNLRLLAGRPLIEHTLRAALASPSIERVLVTTDDADIAAVARSVEGVEVPFVRPAALATDTASAIDVYLHVADWMRETEGRAPSTLVPLLPTSPLRLPEDIDGAISLFRERAAEVVMSVQAAKPLAWHQRMGTNGQLTAVTETSPQAAVANRQEIGQAVVVLNGSVYVLNVEALRRTRTYFGPRSFGYLMPAERSIDIDTEDDLRLAESLLRSRQHAS